jgi:ornithine cyclodeaminase/alanine dehydrogenase-like protein (mu-crystallin family)
MLFLTESEVRGLLPMPEAIRLMRLAFEALGKGAAQNQPRRRLILPTGSVLHSMAGAYGDYFGTKIYSTNPKHGAYFLFALYDAATAQPLALMEANYLGQIRTGAASGYATDLLANPEASILGIVGSGFQAHAQWEAIRAVRPIREVRVWSRDPAKRKKFAADHGAIEAGSVEAAVRGAHIVATATNAKDPVVEDSWIESGVHINAMGSNVATRRELPAELVQRAGLIAVDSLEQARLEAGDLILANSWHNTVELQTLSRQYDPRRITVFKSIGLGLEDVAVGGYVYEQARQQGLGRPLYS